MVIRIGFEEAYALPSVIIFPQLGTGSLTVAVSATAKATADQINALKSTTGVTATDGSGSETATTWFGGSPTTDWMLVRVIISTTSATGVGDLADSLIHIWYDDGTNQRLLRTIDPGNPAAGSTTVSAYQIEVSFGPEYIFPGNVNISFTVSVTPTAGNVDFVVLGQAS